MDPTRLLSTEIWSKVLVLLKPGPAEHRRLQQERLGLRLVCNVFKAVYDSEPGLLSGLHLPRSFSHVSIPSLLAWLRRHAVRIQFVSADCPSPFLDAALTGFLCLNIALKEVCVLSSCTESTVQSLSNFHTLTRIKLFLGADIDSLSPLGVLSNLQTLQLASYGSTVTTNELPQHLTRLTLRLCVFAL